MNNEKLDELFRQACIETNEAEIKRYIKAGADIHYFFDEAFENACKYNQLSIVKILVEASIDLKEKQSCFYEVACKYGRIEIVTYLLKMKINIDSYDHSGLRSALNYKNKEMIDFFIKNGNKNYIEQNQDALLNNIHLDIAKYLVVKHNFNPSEILQSKYRESEFISWFNNYKKSKCLSESLDKTLISKKMLNKKIKL